MKRFDIINRLIESKGYKTYLEIGVRHKPDCFDRIKIQQRIGVDPDPEARAEYRMTSDEFFAINRNKFDIILIDGLHIDEQVAKDIDNSLGVLNKGGAIVLHDCNPPTEFAQREVYEVNGEFPMWNGTTWKAWVNYRRSQTSSRYMNLTVDTDFGVGLILDIGTSEPLDIIGEVEYNFLEEYRERLLNLITIETFKEICDDICVR